MSVRVLPEAQDEADDAVRYLERQRPGYGTRFGAAVLDLYQRLQGMPYLYAEVDPPVPGRDVRMAPVSRFSYVVVDEITGEGTLVVAVAHTSRRPGYWLHRLP